MDGNYSQLNFWSRIARLSNASLQDPLKHKHTDPFKNTWRLPLDMESPPLPSFSHPTSFQRSLSFFSCLFSESWLPEPSWLHRSNQKTVPSGNLEVGGAHRGWLPLLLTLPWKSCNTRWNKHISSHVTDRWLALFPLPHFFSKGIKKEERSKSKPKIQT